MLEISQRNGSYRDPLVGPRLVSTACQTEEATSDTAFKIMEVSSSLSSKPPKSSSTCSTSGGTANEVEKGGGGCAGSAVSSHFMNGAIIQEDAISPQRPLSSASEGEESESSFSEDDEISFNTIKRQVKPKPQCDPSRQSEEAVNQVVNNEAGDSKVKVLNGQSIDNNNGHHIEEESSSALEDNRCSKKTQLSSNSGEAIIEQSLTS